MTMAVRQLLNQGKLEEALLLAAKYLENSPDDPEGIYLKAVCLRYLERVSEALLELERLIVLSPTHARAFQERGHCYRSLEDWGSAASAYIQAVALNPALVSSWRVLKQIHSSDGNQVGYQQAQAQVDYWEGLPLELISTMSLIYEGDLAEAEQLCRTFLQNHPTHVEAMRMLAYLGVRHQIYDDAEYLLESALDFDPENQAIRRDYVEVLHKRQKFDLACQQAAILLRKDPQNPDYKLIHANQNAAVGSYDAALEAYDELLEDWPESPYPSLLKGHALKTIGKQAEAILSYRIACTIRPDFGDAYWSLANLKTYQFSDEEVQTMHQAATLETTPGADKMHLYFALGKALEDKAEWKLSFDYYAAGNQIKKNTSRYSADRTEQDFARQKSACNTSLFDDRKGYGCHAPDPIFIVGLPRSGSTLLEQILASHSQIDGTLELPNIMAVAHRLNGRRQLNEEPLYPAVLGKLSPEACREMGEEYIRSTQMYRQGASRFTDKMPNNFRHIGLIHLILPNAKIVDARRHPLGCCFSGFKQLFAEGQEFSYSLEDIGRYYKDYVSLMDHWDRVLPRKVLRVHYEDVVSDFETQVRRLLDFLGLPFEQRCLDFHQTRRSVRTASSEQVRQPLYESSINQWRQFEQSLEPLKTSLGDTLNNYGHVEKNP